MSHLAPPSSRRASWRDLGAGRRPATLAAVLLAAASVASASPGAVGAHASPRPTHPPATGLTAAQKGAITSVVGTLWIECAARASRRALEVPAVAVVVDLLAANGEITTTVTDRRGRFAFTTHQSGQLEIEIPLIQARLTGYRPAPADGTSGRRRSVGRRIADLDEARVAAGHGQRGAESYDFGFVASGARARGRTLGPCEA
jgi:hypothetical protein